jgi:endonuclease/exonuclease/phosphatase family metal-dependent hydrolase
MYETVGLGGVGILSREEPLAEQIFPLTADEGEGHKQGLLIVEFPKYLFASIAMSSSLAERMAATAKLKEEAAKTRKPFFFGGSLSVRFGSVTVDDLVRDFTPLVDLDARTWPAGRPLALVDYLFMYNRNIRDFEIGALSVPTAPEGTPAASTHLPVVAEVTFR